jgi:hypothetical protein
MNVPPHKAVLAALFGQRGSGGRRALDIGHDRCAKCVVHRLLLEDGPKRIEVNGD